MPSVRADRRGGAVEGIAIPGKGATNRGCTWPFLGAGGAAGVEGPGLILSGVVGCNGATVVVAFVDFAGGVNTPGFGTLDFVGVDGVVIVAPTPPTISNSASSRSS
jgi:hypothetical protein